MSNKLRKCNNCGTILEEKQDSFFKTYSFFCKRCDKRQLYWKINKLQ